MRRVIIVSHGFSTTKMFVQSDFVRIRMISILSFSPLWQIKSAITYDNLGGYVTSVKPTINNCDISFIIVSKVFVKEFRLRS